MAEPDQPAQAQPATSASPPENLPGNLVTQAEPGRDAETLVHASPAVTLVDAGIIALILGLALWYLYRQFWRRRGECGGCAKGGEGGCAVSRSIAKMEDQAPAATCVSVDAIRKRS